MSEVYSATPKCVEKNQGSIPGSTSNADSALFYNVEAKCRGMSCPPYDVQVCYVMSFSHSVKEADYVFAV